MTKSKTSTIAIVVLSVLLAAALASTIVLAAFTFSRTATTTIQFAGGITLTVDGIHTHGSGDTATYSWIVLENNADNTNKTVNVDGGKSVALKQVKATVSSGTAYIAVKATVTETNGPEVTPSYSDKVVDATKVAGLSTAAGWMIVGSGTTASTTATDGEAVLINETSIFTYGTDATAYEGASYSTEVLIAAATSIEDLAKVITQLDA